MKKEKSNLYNPANCPSKEELNAYANDALSAEKLKIVETKLNHCPNEDCLCSEIIEGLQLEKIAKNVAQKEPQLMEGYDAEALLKKIKPMVIQTEAQKQHNQSGKIRNLNPNLSFLLAVAAVVALIILFTYIFLGDSDQESQNLLVDKDKTEKNTEIKKQEEKKPEELKGKPVPEEKKPENLQNSKELPKNTLAFAENEELEELVKTTVRDSGEVSEFKPANNSTFEKEVVFSWKSEKPITFYIEILDNQKNTIHKSTIASGLNQYILDIKKYKPGLYYWKLTDEEELRCVGKFRID